ncbi:hypothetical protein [Parvularcula maris]|uniref:Uncharacterized protein n=1 Tax=Parvularcula maris TaxID=2965077 RepID=A0A9X2RIC5_9PROT|nr:hypothetical protein [Parvularcula maris]MCQ8185895.1 hypothetical protein [Parvularcula maris]
MRHTKLMLLAGAALLASCGEPAPETGENPREDAAAEAPTSSPRMAQARADLEFGQFESAVGDLTSYESVPFGFQSLVLAANGAAGISAIRADGGEASTIEPRGEPPYRLAVTYDGEGAGQLFVLDSAGGLAAFSLPSGEEMASNDIAYVGIQDICSNGTVVLGVGSGGGRVLMGDDDGLAAQVPEGASACEGVNGEFYVRDGEGWSRLTGQGLDPTPLPSNAVALVGTGEEVFAIGVNGAGGELLINERAVKTIRADGSPLRPLQVAPAYGNLGGVTRDGGLIVLDEERRLYLLPWAEVATALELPTNLPSQRPARAAETLPGPTLPTVQDSPAISFEEREQPEAELPAPPSGGGR